MPRITSAFNGWQSRITLLRHNETVDVNGFVDDTAQKLSFYGTIQPLKPREIELKPEGQRSFTWLGTDLSNECHYLNPWRFYKI